MYLGIELDSQRRKLRLPPAKLNDLLQELESWFGRRKTSKRRLLSLIGKLSFAAKVVPASRLFLRCLINLSTTASQLHHHITLNSQARADIQWWLKFLPAWNGKAMFLDTTWVSAQFYTDASGIKGYGAYFAGAWLCVTGNHINSSHSDPSNGRRCSPSWQQPPHGPSGYMVKESVSAATTSKILAEKVCETPTN